MPAAVFPSDDPRVVNLARTVPAGASIQRIGDWVLGYTKAPVASAAQHLPRQKYSLIEMTGRWYRKALQGLVALRREDGLVLDDHVAWTAVAADIAAAIFGAGATVRNVEGQCLFMGIEVERATVILFHARAAQWRRASDYAPMTGDEVGRLVRLTWRERDALIERGIGGATRIGSIDETPGERRKRKDRDRKAEQRAAARSHKAQRPWKALGMKRSTYYHRRAWTDSVCIFQ